MKKSILATYQLLLNARYNKDKALLALARAYGLTPEQIVKLSRASVK